MYLIKMSERLYWNFCRSRQEVEAFRSAHKITVKGDAPNPIQHFEEVNFPDYVANEIR
jgi:ATP-dependent RNA helicase DDX5/DBP2